MATVSIPDYQERIAQFILDCEARRDANGHLVVYRLPPGDGGGRYEIAGINDRYDHDAADHLAEMLGQHQYKEAEEYCREYYLHNTDAVAGWTRVPAVEAFLRDTAFNRGVKGCAKIVQMALHVDADGVVGPITRAALANFESQAPANLLAALRFEREVYEKEVAPPKGDRAKFWNGLVNRWDAALAFAEGML